MLVTFDGQVQTKVRRTSRAYELSNRIFWIHVYVSTQMYDVWSTCDIHTYIDHTAHIPHSSVGWPVCLIVIDLLISRNIQRNHGVSGTKLLPIGRAASP